MIRTARRDPDAMSLGEHLAELRRRIVISAGAFVVGAVISYIMYNRVLQLFQEPLCRARPHNCALYVTTPLSGFSTHLDVTGYGGLLIASPVILFQLWRFVTPGLKASEKRYALPFVAATLLLFLLGAYVAWLTYPHALGFLLGAAGKNVDSLLSPASYISLLLALMAIFGLTFEFPVVLVALELAHVVTPAQLSKFRRIAIIIVVIAAGVLTPSSDPFSMLAMAIPMLVFYELSIVIGRLLKR